MSAALQLSGVRAGYGNIEVLHGVDLSVGVGEVLAVLGPNGAGKSTALKIASGLMTPTAGKVLVAGRDVTGASADALARCGLVTVPEGRGVFQNLTVRDNLVMATYSGTSMAEIEEETYRRFPRLKERRKQIAGTLSGGEQQMLALARGLAARPALLMMDELSMGLAPLIVAELYDLVASIAAEGVSILVIEQFASTVLGIADQAAIMVHGRVVAVGPPAEVESTLSTAYLGGGKP